MTSLGSFARTRPDFPRTQHPVINGDFRHAPDEETVRLIDFPSSLVMWAKPKLKNASIVSGMASAVAIFTGMPSA